MTAREMELQTKIEQMRARAAQCERLGDQAGYFEARRSMLNAQAELCLLQGRYDRSKEGER